MAVILQINSGIIGSTGSIMMTIDRYAEEAGYTSYMASVNNYSSRNNYPANHYAIGTILEKRFHRKMAAITGKEGCYSYFATKRLLKFADKIKPDIIQLHNLHWCYINLPLLFDYFKKNPQIRVVWTLHDCWSYTGHCPYYDMVECSKWKTGCYDCPSFRQYPVSNVDNSRENYARKREWFNGVENMTLVTPSKWLSSEIEDSFLANYDKRLISNGIEADVFEYIENDLKSHFGIEDKFVILGCAFTWIERKGFDCFLKLADMIPDSCRIMMVGGFTDEQKKQCEKAGIICVDRVSSKTEMARIYSGCDVFFNPTREEMFGLVNIEAQACGTPVITFASGGSPECIGEHGGFVVEKDDLNTVVDIIDKMQKNDMVFDRIIVRDWVKTFDADLTYKRYIQLYDELIAAKNEAAAAD